MKAADKLKREIKAASATLMRRKGSTTDEAERRAILDAVDELNGQLTLLNQAAPHDAANAAVNVIATLEKAVAATRLGPFDGYLAALEAHFARANQIAGELYFGERLARADAPSARTAKRAKASKKAKAGTRGKAATRKATRGALQRASLESVTPQINTSTVFADLEQEYQDSFDRCTLRPEFAGDLAFCLKMLKRGQPSYELVETSNGVPWRFVGIIHCMECGFNFTGHLHNGDPLTKRTVQVPKGRPIAGAEPFTWLQSALDALALRKLDKITDWSVPHMLYQLEGYNGFGYRRQGLVSPYLWSFSSLYTKGKFVKDGKFDPEAVSKQCGAGLLLKSALAA
jgi:lysozyme family protein